MRSFLASSAVLILSAASLMTTGCEDSHDHPDDNEVITTIILTFTPAGGGTPVTAGVNDPDGEGGAPPVVTPLALPAGAYSMAVRFENALETPPEDITAEVRDESDEHQIFFLGTAVKGPASNLPTAPLTHSYNDTDRNGLPVGLLNNITAVPGTGTLTVALRHLPPINDKAVKVAGLAEVVAAAPNGLSSLGGNSDVEVSLSVTVSGP